MAVDEYLFPRKLNGLNGMLLSCMTSEKSMSICPNSQDLVLKPSP